MSKPQRPVNAWRGLTLRKRTGCRFSADIWANEFSPHIAAFAPNNFVSTVPGGSAIAVKQQYKLVDDLEAVKLKPNALLGGIRHQDVAIVNADAKPGRRQPANALPQAFSPLINVREAH
jgi:hypothetical protein